MRMGSSKEKLYLVNVPPEWAGDPEFTMDGDNFHTGETISLGVFRGTKESVIKEIIEMFDLLDSDDEEENEEEAVDEEGEEDGEEKISKK